MRSYRLFPLSRVASVASSLGLALFGICGAAQASGPVERMVQLLQHPTEPNTLVVRFGLAAEGYLYSTDGGRTFRATCSRAVDPSATEDQPFDDLSGARIPGAGATLLDTDGRVVLGHPSGLWTDDGKGCGWHTEAKLAAYGVWPYSIQRDPAKPDELLVQTNITRIDYEAAIWRRAADGSWSKLGLVAASTTHQVGAGELLAVRNGAGVRLYAGVADHLDAVSDPRLAILVSDDGAETWRETGELPNNAGDDAIIFAVDPNDADRLLAVNHHDSAADELLLSTNQGQRFSVWSKVRDATGIVFAPNGRVYIGDAGDQDAEGGVWTAAKLGDPLTKLPSDVPGIGIDCIGLDPASGKLRVCIRHRFGEMDPETGAFEELSRLDLIEELVACEDRDTAAVCEGQFNRGPSWCCTGHYTFTPFCGQYDVTRVGMRNVYCGLAGRDYDIMNGLVDVDGGTEDAGKPDAGARDGGVKSTPRSNKGGGCAIAPHTQKEGSAGGALVSLGALLLALGRTLQRRARRAAKEARQ